MHDPHVCWLQSAAAQLESGPIGATTFVTARSTSPTHTCRRALEERSRLDGELGQTDRADFCECGPMEGILETAQCTAHEVLLVGA